MRLWKLLTVAVLVLAVACGPPPLRHGTVYEKYHRAAFTTTVFIPHQVGKTTVLTPVFTYHPEVWELRVENTDTGKQGSCRTDPATYTRVQVGEFFSCEDS